jgi:plastocyanin
MRHAYRSVLAVGLAVLTALPAQAQSKRRPASSSSDPDIARLERELAEQRQLLLWILQSEQQRYEMLLKLVSSGKAPTGAPPAAMSEMMPDDATPPRTSRPASRPAAAPSNTATGVVEGRITMKGAKPNAAYVYVENLTASAAGGASFEIKQENKQFYPRVAVVQKGTRLTFPNLDTIFHNVFSVSPGNTFDLGTYRAGDKARSVVVTSPGVVEIFCNMHSRMSASVLVVPNALFTKVGADGTFRLANVPVGSRKIVAWAPSAKPAVREVDVTPTGASAEFTLEINDRSSHTNKFGQPYGSYED